MDHLSPALQKVSQQVRAYVLADEYPRRLRAPHLTPAVLSYLQAGGKSLRSALLLWSCGAVGGDLEAALPAAAAVEVYHTWTLVHDDIIDRDDQRRGVPTVHEQARVESGADFGLDLDEARHYGISLAVLTGDLQHAWAVTMLTRVRGNDVARALVAELETRVLCDIAEGEAFDLQYSHRPVGEVSEDEIIAMLAQKTASLYRFAAQAGAMIGRGRADFDDETVTALGEFAFRTGIAFQLHDDILGLLGKGADLGKPVGSDLREGKRTAIIRYAWDRTNAAERELLGSVLGNPAATAGATAEATALLERVGAIDHARELAEGHYQAGLAQLDRAPAGPYRDLLRALAQAMVERSR